MHTKFPRPLQLPLRYARKEMQQSSGSTLGVSGIESLRKSYHHLLPVVVAANVSAPTSVEYALHTYVRASQRKIFQRRSSRYASHR